MTTAEYQAYLARHGRAAPAAKPRAKRFHGDTSKAKAWRLDQMTRPGLFLPLRLVSEANARDGHFAKAERTKRTRFGVSFAVLAGIRDGKFPAALPVRVKIIRMGPKLLDGHDNLPRSAKAAVDAVADAYGKPDHDPGYEWIIEQEQSPANCYGVRITIERSL